MLLNEIYLTGFVRKILSVFFFVLSLKSIKYNNLISMKFILNFILQYFISTTLKVFYINFFWFL